MSYILKLVIGSEWFIYRLEAIVHEGYGRTIFAYGFIMFSHHVP